MTNGRGRGMLTDGALWRNHFSRRHQARHGIHKAYGINKLRTILGIAIEEMIFVGDALFPGGNDYPAKEAGVVSIHVTDPDESKRVIETILACMGPPNHG